MKTLAAVLVKTGEPLELAEVQIPVLRPGQVLVEISHSGVCHTQVLECRGFRGPDIYLPHCLGHEGAGAVLAVGAGVSKVKPQDRVILSWMKGSGMDVSSSAYQWNGRPVHAGGITTFSRHAVISENRVTKISDGLSSCAAALLGCAIPTGMGSVLHTANPKPGQSLLVFGTGAVGLFAVAAAALSCCGPIIAVDLKSEKLELAKKMGATHIINSEHCDLLREVEAICPEGLDFVIEATGRPSVMAKSLSMVRARGGSIVVIGNARFGERLEIDPRELNMGKRIFGTWGGDNVPDFDFPRYCEFILSKKVNVEPLISEPYRLRHINQALDDLESGKVTRPLIDMSLG